ncbi:hypothetical protein NQ318_021165 [Aromia moschata]|uniref:Uncharacterized protein n=1 Tax=Aromia moschata TaxID=1265417 RepID=A0AAV8YF11_9CUCU|nr:hypothetical protein NQ318_021165 [Aromia moschata]
MIRILMIYRNLTVVPVFPLTVMILKLKRQPYSQIIVMRRFFQTYQKSVITNSVATSVIATTSNTCAKEEEENPSQNIINMNLAPDNNKGESSKPNERIQSVLVTACSSNGPMLSHSTPRYRKPADTARTNNNELPNKEEFLHNGEKTNNNEQKTF